MKDNPGPGGALGGGKKGRKAWEIDEEATCELKCISTMFGRNFWPPWEQDTSLGPVLPLGPLG